MELAESILKDINSIPSEIKHYDMYTNELLDNQVKIYTIKENIINLVCKCGSSTLVEILELVVGDNWIENFNKSSEIYTYFLNDVFIPSYCNTIKLDKQEVNKIQVKLSDIVNATLIEKIDGASIEIPYDKTLLIVNGYFKKDPLNIHKKYNVLSKKFSEILNKSENIDIPKDFVEGYLNQMTTRDLVILSIEKIIRKIQRDFDYLNKLKTQLLSSLVKEFMMSNIQDQRRILTLFLLSSESETQHLAYLMYDMISTSSDTLKPQFMAEEIYKSLHWSVQKLFKIAFKNVEKYRKSLLNLNEENISYEDRIVQMRASDAVKSKAIDKLKEVKSSKDSIKASNYLDGLLKIPFGIYKKEKILSFLEDFSNNLSQLFNEIDSSIKLINPADDILINIKVKVNELILFHNSNKFITENQIDEFINKLESILKDINTKISENSEYNDISEKKMNELNEVKKIDSINSLQKLAKMKEIKTKIEETNDNNVLNNMEKEIDNNIKSELENYKNTLYGFPESPKLVKLKTHKIIQNGMEYDEFNNDNSNSIIIEEFNKWISIESQLMNLINEWIKYKHSKKEYMTKSREVLDDCIYGQLDAKKHIERLIAQWINGKMEGNVFGFQGPPGVGKTTLCKKGLAKCLVDEDGNSRPFAFIPLGGSTNGSILDGHSYTYVGSTWGKIVDILIETKCMNPIIYIDELDKVSKTEHGREIIGILTHLTDPSQNDEFTDKFFAGIKLDLSKCLIVFSYNDSSLIDGILADRITEVKVKSITKKEKLHIVKEYLMPEILETVGYMKGDIILNNDEINYIIENYTYEAGVRKLKERLFELVREINLIRVLETEEINLPFILTEEYIKKLFSDRPKVQYKKIAKEPQIGLVNGLFATSSGTGGITIIEVMRTPSDTKLSLELTGKQGDVMKESMRCAKTIAWNLLPYETKKNINKEWEEVGPFGLHIHCPEAATPKDGPSAGLAITLAVLSRLCNIKIKNTVGMTGEIDLNGKSHQIGGLESKLDGAKRAGITKVLVPEDNRQDYDRIIENLSEDDKGSYNENFEIVFVQSIEDVIKHSLVENNLQFNF
jgi:endopeptidase La